jgi:Tfp pilus assembly protein PilF
MLGELYLLENEVTGAIEHFNKAREANPQFVTAYRNLAVSYIRSEDQDRAVKVLKDGLKETKHAAPLVVDLSLMYEQRGEIESAIALYEEAMKNSDSESLDNNLAMLLATHKKDQASLERASQLVEKFKESKNPAYLDTLGWVHYVKGNLDEAQTFLQQAVDAAPNQPLLRYHLAKTQYKKGDSPSALVNLEAALNSKQAFREREEAKSLMDEIKKQG